MLLGPLPIHNRSLPIEAQALECLTCTVRLRCPPSPGGDCGGCSHPGWAYPTHGIWMCDPNHW